MSGDDALRGADAAGSPGPRRADQDLALLARPELRSVRLLLEYLKPELRLEDRGVRHSIVVFGSIHLLDEESARDAVVRAERDAAARPEDPVARAVLRRARSDLARSRYYEIGRELGRIVGGHPPSESGHRLAVVTGGGSGGMEAANRGAREVGGESVGFNIALPEEQRPNPWITPGLGFEFRYFALRKLHFMLRARALVTLPGGYGTLDELFETLCLLQTRKRDPMPVVLIGEAFWRKAVDFDFLVAEGMVEPEDLALFQFAETARQAWDAILDWYAARGRSIFDFPPGREEVLP